MSVEYISEHSGSEIDASVENTSTLSTNLSTLSNNIDTLTANVNNINIASLGVCNPNLLYNPWFIINQRQQGTYQPSTGSGGCWFKDCWYTNIVNGKYGDASNGGSYTYVTSWDNTSIALHSGQKATEGEWGVIDLYTLLTNYDSQMLFGKTVTFSAKTNHGIFSTTCTLPSNPDLNTYDAYQVSWFQNSMIGLIIENDAGGHFRFIIRNELQDGATIGGREFWIYATKLELGSISTLVNEFPADYQSTLLACQGFYWRANIATTGWGVGFKPSGLGAIEIPLMGAPKMRIINPNYIMTSIEAFSPSQGWISMTSSNMEYYALNGVPLLRVYPADTTNFNTYFPDNYCYIVKGQIEIEIPSSNW